jgi:hypothetical protein
MEKTQIYSWNDLKAFIDTLHEGVRNTQVQATLSGSGEQLYAVTGAALVDGGAPAIQVNS